MCERAVFETGDFAETAFRELIRGMKQGNLPIRESMTAIDSRLPFCNTSPMIALKYPDRKMQLDKSRTIVSRGGSKSSAEREFWAGQLWDRGWGGAAPTGSARDGRMGKFGQARLHCRGRAGTVVRADAGSAGAKTRPGLLAG